MGWDFLDLFEKKDKQPEERSAQEIHEQLIKVFSRDHLYSSDYYYTISRQTKPVLIKRIPEKKWKQIQYLCVLLRAQPISGDVQLIHEASISKDGSWLFIDGEKIAPNPIIRKCAQNLRFLRIEIPLDAPLDVSPMKQLRFLHVDLEDRSDKTTMRIIGLEQLEALETLRLYGTFDFTTLNVSHMKALQKLTISRNQHLQAVEGLDTLPWLKHLTLWRVNHIQTLELSGVDQLEHLQLGYLTNLTTLPMPKQFINLRTLNLRSNRSMHLQSVDLTGLRMLEYLSLENNPALREIRGLKTLEKLQHLDISQTAIRTIPDDLRGKPLKKLNLSGLKLDALPDWLPELGLPFCKLAKF